MNGGVPSKKSNKKLLKTLDQLKNDSNLLDDSDFIKRIRRCLKAVDDPNVQNEANGKTLLHYIAEHNSISGIKFLLEEKEVNPNVRDQDGKTPLHYAAKNNCLQAIKLLLKGGAKQDVKNKSGKTPFEYVTEHNCLQAFRDYGLDDSHENKGNPTTPDDSVGESNDYSNSSGDDSQVKSVKLSDCNTEEDSDCYSDGSCENEENPANNPSNDPNKHNDDQGYGSGNNNKTNSTEPSDCDRKDENSSSSSSDYLFLEDSLLAKLEIPLTTHEQELIDKFCEEIRGITAQNKQESEESILESIEKIVNEYLKKGIRLNLSCSNDNGKTIANLIFEEMAEVISQFRVSLLRDPYNYDDSEEGDGKECQTLDTIIKEITSSLVLKGGIEKKLPFYDNLASDHYDFDYLSGLNKQYKDRKKELKSIACEGIVGRDGQAKKAKLEAVGIDNQCFYMKYPQDSIIEPVKILNNEKAKKLNLKVDIIQIGKSIVRVEDTKDGKRNYTDVLKGNIEMSFTTEVGEISIYLSPSKEGGNKIEVEIDDESEAKLNKLKAEKKSLGENCLLGGKSVLEAIEAKGFKKNGNVPTESIEITKDVPFTGFTQACLQQIDISGKGRQ